MTVRHLPRGFSALNDYLGNKSERPLCNNTAVRRDGESIVVRLHRTNIVVFYEDGSIYLDSGGWKSVTTKARMNAVLPSPWSVGQHKHEWYVNGKPFYDGMKLEVNGDVTATSTTPT